MIARPGQDVLRFSVTWTYSSTSMVSSGLGKTSIRSKRPPKQWLRIKYQLGRLKRASPSIEIFGTIERSGKSATLVLATNAVDCRETIESVPCTWNRGPNDGGSLRPPHHPTTESGESSVTTFPPSNLRMSQLCALPSIGSSMWLESPVYGSKTSRAAPLRDARRAKCDGARRCMVRSLLWTRGGRKIASATWLSPIAQVGGHRRLVMLDMVEPVLVLGRVGTTNMAIVHGRDWSGDWSEKVKRRRWNIRERRLRAESGLPGRLDATC